MPILGILGFFALLSGLLLVVALAPFYGVQFFGARLSGFLLALSSTLPVHGRNPRQLVALAFLERLSPGLVAGLLAAEEDDDVARVLAALPPRFARRVRGALAPHRRERVDYWLAHPQPFPRREQMALARRFKVALRKEQIAY